MSVSRPPTDHREGKFLGLSFTKCAFTFGLSMAHIENNCSVLLVAGVLARSFLISAHPPQFAPFFLHNFVSFRSTSNSFLRAASTFRTLSALPLRRKPPIISCLDTRFLHRCLACVSSRSPSSSLHPLSRHLPCTPAPLSLASPALHPLSGACRPISHKRSWLVVVVGVAYTRQLISRSCHLMFCKLNRPQSSQAASKESQSPCSWLGPQAQ
jgi:hypothetical protein